MDLILLLLVNIEGQMLHAFQQVILTRKDLITASSTTSRITATMLQKFAKCCDFLRTFAKMWRDKTQNT